MAHILSPRKIIIFLVFATASLSAAFYAHHLHKQKQAALHAEQIKLAQEEREAKRAALQILFDDYLNAFKNELKEEAKLYKQNQKVLKEIASPLNFETPEYTKENYTLFKEELAPSLRAQSNKIIGVFEKYTTKIKENLQDSDNETQTIFLEKWQEMSQAQLTHYVDFFTKEEQLIQAYEELITFYYVHSNLFSIDTKNNIFQFVREKDEEKEAELRQKISDLRK